jgi:hypothetical protein
MFHRKYFLVRRGIRRRVRRGMRQIIDDHNRGFRWEVLVGRSVSEWKVRVNARIRRECWIIEDGH